MAIYRLCIGICMCSIAIMEAASIFSRRFSDSLGTGRERLRRRCQFCLFLHLSRRWNQSLFGDYRSRLVSTELETAVNFFGAAVMEDIWFEFGRFRKQVSFFFWNYLCRYGSSISGFKFDYAIGFFSNCMTLCRSLFFCVSDFYICV